MRIKIYANRKIIDIDDIDKNKDFLMETIKSILEKNEVLLIFTEKERNIKLVSKKQKKRRKE